MRVLGEDPHMLRLGQVVSFYKGKGGIALAASMRSIRLSNAILNVRRKFVRSRCKDILFGLLKDEQSGGRPGVGTDFACIAVRMRLHLLALRGRSAVAASLDLVAAFYRIVRQVVMSIPSVPSDQDKIPQAIDELPIPPAFRFTVLRLAERPIFGGGMSDRHFMELLRGVQAGSWWQCRGVDSCVSLSSGTKPGTAFACD
eukprot:3295009-Pyramimonas_sp.AAC.1